MAIGWLTLLTKVPWVDVVSSAPKVAEGARKLWNAVGKKPASAGQPAAAATLPPEQMAARVAALEDSVADLKNQMVASSELITALADQNAQLVQGIGVLRRRLIWLAIVLAVVAVVAVFALLR